MFPLPAKYAVPPGNPSLHSILDSSMLSRFFPVEACSGICFCAASALLTGPRGYHLPNCQMRIHFLMDAESEKKEQHEDDKAEAARAGAEKGRHIEVKNSHSRVFLCAFLNAFEVLVVQTLLYGHPAGGCLSIWPKWFFSCLSAKNEAGKRRRRRRRGAGKLHLCGILIT